MSFDEFLCTTQALGLCFDFDFLYETFGQLDVNHNGKISCDEFRTAIQVLISWKTPKISRGSSL